MTYEWEGRLRSGSAGDTTVDLLYDPDGNRVFRQVTAGDPNSTPTVTQRKYVVDAESDLPVILLEIDPDASDPNASVVKTYLYAHAQILAQHDGHYAESIYFYLHDRLGSVRQVIDADGAVANTYTYEPFGLPFASEVAETVSNPWQFTGQYFDAEIAQYYLRARMYDPAIYRFTGRDPDLGQWTEPLTLHRYLYCLNDPIDRIDLTGEFSYGEILVTTAHRGMQAYNMYGTYRKVLRYAERVAEGASFRSVALSAVGDVAMSVATGKLIGVAVRGGTAAIGAAGRVAKTHMHHVWPKFLGGAEKGIRLPVSEKLHTWFHKKLYKRLQSHFGKSCRSWSTVQWTEFLEQNPQARHTMWKELIEMTAELDKKLGGVDVTAGLFEQILQQM